MFDYQPGDPLEVTYGSAFTQRDWSRVPQRYAYAIRYNFAAWGLSREEALAAADDDGACASAIASIDRKCEEMAASSSSLTDDEIEEYRTLVERAVARVPVALADHERAKYPGHVFSARSADGRPWPGALKRHEESIRRIRGMLATSRETAASAACHEALDELGAPDPCYVLNDGVRVWYSSSTAKDFGRGQGRGRPVAWVRGDKWEISDDAASTIEADLEHGRRAAKFRRYLRREVLDMVQP